MEGLTDSFLKQIHVDNANNERPSLITGVAAKFAQTFAYEKNNIAMKIN
jgi:hypothetical protein